GGNPGVRLALARGPALLRSRLRTERAGRRRDRALRLLYRLATVRRGAVGARLLAQRPGPQARRHGAGLPGGREGVPDRHGGTEGPPARVLLPGPRRRAARTGLRLPPLRNGSQDTEPELTPFSAP